LGPRKIVSIDTDSEIVHILPLVDIKAPLVVLIGDTISYFFADHHHGRLHKVVHYIFQLGFESFQVNRVEINVVHGRHLEPVCVLNVVDGPSDLDLVEAFPEDLLRRKTHRFLEEADLA
jgi:hypothetical protein